MPEVAANTESATLADWLIAESGRYSSTDALATIETDKAVLDLTAEADGVLLRILAAPGTEVRVGDPIAVIGRPGESATDTEAIAALLSGLAAAPGAIGAEGGTGEGPVAAVEANGVAPERVFVSPLARKMAADAGIATAAITGTGPGGRIVRDDVRRAIEAAAPALGAALAQDAPSPAGTPALAAAPLPSAAPVPAGAPSPAAAPSPVAAFVDVPHSRMRRAIATRLTQSKQQIPHFYVRGSAVVDELLALRRKVNEATGTKVSLNDWIIKAVARAHQLVPAANVTWTDDALRQYASVDLGVAVATETGLFTPVVRNVERLSLTELAGVTRDLAERARQGGLRQHELEGGTSTVTNLGMYGTEEFAAIINPPQSSILAVGAARPEPVAADGAVEVCSVVHVTLSVDHRAIDGAVAAQWMRALVETLEAPLRILV